MDTDMVTPKRPTWAPGPCRRVAISYHGVGFDYYSPSLPPLPCPVRVGNHGSHCPQKFYCVKTAAGLECPLGAQQMAGFLRISRGCPPDIPSHPCLHPGHRLLSFLLFLLLAGHKES